MNATEQRKTATAKDTPDNRADKYERAIAISAIAQAFCAVLLVLFTGLLAHYGYRGWKTAVIAANAAQSSAEMAEQSLRLSQRAYLGVKGIHFILSKPARLIVFIENFGKTPAKKIRVNLRRSHRVDAPDKLDYGSLELADESHDTAGEMMPNVSFPLPVPTVELTEQQISGVINKQWFNYIFGFVRYDDGFGQDCQLDVSYFYNPDPPAPGFMTCPGKPTRYRKQQS